MPYIARCSRRQERGDGWRESPKCTAASAEAAVMAGDPCGGCRVRGLTISAHAGRAVLWIVLSCAAYVGWRRYCVQRADVRHLLLQQ